MGKAHKLTGHRFDESFRRVLDVMRDHPAISEATLLTVEEESDSVFVDATFMVSMPNPWKERGESPSGVKRTEIVRFRFPKSFPLESPEPSLRPDFTRNLPHIQPYVSKGRPVPCIFDGDLAELLQKEGLPGILNQTHQWLERAALETLIDPNQGWEPVRRDSLSDFIVANADTLRGLVDRNGGYKFFEFTYLRRILDEHSTESVCGALSDDPIRVNKKYLNDNLRELEFLRDRYIRGGKSLALVAWPGKRPSGELIVCSQYLPETVTNVNEIKDRAVKYGCAKELTAGFDWLKRCFSGFPKSGPFKLAIVLLARRPCKIIGSNSLIELCPYVMDIYTPNLFLNGGATSVRPAGHREVVSRNLLSRMAGIDDSPQKVQWTLLGAGSLGSKIAIYLARSGQGPSAVVDRSVISPHNAARHALIPDADNPLHWMGSKAELLCDALKGLNQEATAATEDIRQKLPEHNKDWNPKRTWAIVNATASLSLRNMLAASKDLRTRVIETSLYTSGQLGLITVEGPERNPNTGDLIAEFYAFLDPSDALIIFGNEKHVARQRTGEGCGSFTMSMSDGRLSIFAGGMSEYIRAKQLTSLPIDGGEVIIGRLKEDGLGINWQREIVPPVTLVGSQGASGWRVHIHQRALTKINEECDRWPNAETGGVLIGRHSEVSQTFNVVDTLAAPLDSIRTSSGFVLGVEGLKDQLNSLIESRGGTLYCLGTWHNHLADTGPSSTDQATARAIDLACLTPSVLLIRTPTGFRVLVAEKGDQAKGEAND